MTRFAPITFGIMWYFDMDKIYENTCWCTKTILDTLDTKEDLVLVG